MTDIVSPKKRSTMMAGIKATNTKPELIVRKALFRRGFRYRIHNRKLPGKPDLTLPKYHTVIFVHGCFWHGHGCSLFKWPKSNTQFWKEKIGANCQRDQRNTAQLEKDGWQVMIIWECMLRGKHEEKTQQFFDALAGKIRGEYLG